MYRIPARDTVAGVAVLKVAISNSSRIDLVKAIRSLLAKVSTLEVYIFHLFQVKDHLGL